jgi:hypothetical protein
VRLDDGKFGKFTVRLDFGTSLHSSQTCPRRSGLANNHEQTQSCLQSAFIWRMSVKRSFHEMCGWNHRCHLCCNFWGLLDDGR